MWIKTSPKYERRIEAPVLGERQVNLTKMENPLSAVVADAGAGFRIHFLTCMRTS